MTQKQGKILISLIIVNHQHIDDQNKSPHPYYKDLSDPMYIKLKLPDMALKEPTKNELERARLGSCRTKWHEQR